MCGLDVKSKRVGARKAQYISRLCVFAFENRDMKNVIFRLRGNISKQALMIVAERFRCFSYFIGGERAGWMLKKTALFA